MFNQIKTQAEYDIALELVYKLMQEKIARQLESKCYLL